MLSFVVITSGLASVAQTHLYTDRPDGLSLSSRGTVEKFLNAAPPKLQFDTAMTRADFARWRSDMGAAMAALMKHPAAQAAPPRMVAEAQRTGYRVQKWESYPLPGSVVPFLVMIPDGADVGCPAALCIPGFGQTKELLAGERAGNYTLAGEPDSVERKAAMGLHYVRKGLVAVVVDNPSCGELSDEGYFDYLATSRFLLEAGWSYLGLASWQDKVILDWMKTQPSVDPDRIIVSGFSLGTEPLMVLGLLDPSIKAFVYNDFLCRTRERAMVMNRAASDGSRPFPNSIEHLIPEFLTYFDFPDIVAALAPRPVICTEGGLDRDFELIRRAYDIAGAPDAFEYHHYAMFANPQDRADITVMPNGIDRTEFFRLANVDPPHHYFKTEWVLPWIDRILK
ncbi:MAG: alpha/beta hydrolase family protein [Muribaculaceae bacterium]|nr:alpha/beta hydrolase family protein [Muribaculaceae bacterium]